VAEPETGKEIKVRVSFPISKRGPYEQEFTPDTTVGIVLADAMKYFEVENDTQFVYVLSYDGREQDPATTLGSLVGHSREVRFTLVKKITQG